jgi:hypothetical protein
MSSSIASLFGPTAEEIVYAKQQQDNARRQQQLQQGLATQSSPLAQQFYQAGYNIASGLGSMFGPAPMQDPRLAQSIKIRQILGNTSVDDLSDPAKVSQLSKEFQDAGLAREALYFADRATSLATAAYARDFKEREMQLKYGTTKPTDYRVVNADGSISNVEQRGNRYFNSTTGEEITDFSKIRKAGELKPTTEAKASTKLRLRSKFLKESGFDVDVKDQVAQDIYERAIRIVNESRGALEMSDAEQQAYNEMIEKGVIVPSSNYFGDWKYNPSADSTQTEVSVAKPRTGIKTQQAQERGLSEVLPQGATTRQIRQTPDGRVFEILIDANGRITYERELK